MATAALVQQVLLKVDGEDGGLGECLQAARVNKLLIDFHEGREVLTHGGGAGWTYGPYIMERGGAQFSPQGILVGTMLVSLCAAKAWATRKRLPVIVFGNLDGDYLDPLPSRSTSSRTRTCTA